jgi:hypothetical protein
MESLHRYWLIVGVLAAVMARPLSAQESAPATEEPTNEEMTYFDLRGSKDHATKQFADRYFNLVKPQEWTSLNGKQKVTAKYVAHDPDLKWVKLATVRGTGANRTTREISVEVAKLNKTCQSRVRQISVLQSKLDELIVAEKERRSESASESRGEYGVEGTRGEEMTEERGGRSGRYGEASTTAESAIMESDANANAAAADQAEVPDGSDDPDPLGFNELAAELTATPASGNSELLGGRASRYGNALPGTGDADGAVDRTQWRTSYQAFRANIATYQGADGNVAVEWRELADLQQMHEIAEASLRDRSDPSRAQITEIADRIGEVQWEGPFAGAGEATEGRRELLFDLPPIAPPLKIRFFADEREIGPWTELPPGTPVRFAGRFDIQQPLEIQVLVRKLD